MTKQPTPQLRPHLLWEYDQSKFNYRRGATVVIERVIERGTIEEWREIVRFYGKEKVLEVAAGSKQLDKRDKHFATIFVHSDMVA